MYIHIPAILVPVAFLVDRATLKGKVMGQFPLGLYTIAHTSTPTSSDAW